MAWLDDIIEKAGEDADLGFDTKSLLSSNKKRRRKGRQLIGATIIRDILNNRFLKQANDDWLNFENNFTSQKAKALRDWNMRAEIDKSHQEKEAIRRKRGYSTLQRVFEDEAGLDWVAKHGERALDLSDDNRKAYNKYKEIEGKRRWKNHQLEYGNFERGPTTLEEFTQPMKTAYETAKKRIYSPYNTTVGGRILRKINPKEEHNDPTAIEFNTKVAEMMANKELPNLKDDPQYAGLPREFGDIDYLDLTDMKVKIKQLDPRYAHIDSKAIDALLNRYQDENKDSNPTEALRWLENISDTELIVSENISNTMILSKLNLANEYLSLDPRNRPQYVVEKKENLTLLAAGLDDLGHSVLANEVLTKLDPSIEATAYQEKEALVFLSKFDPSAFENADETQQSFLAMSIAKTVKYITDPELDRNGKLAIATQYVLNETANSTEYYLSPTISEWDQYNISNALNIKTVKTRNLEETKEVLKTFKENAINLRKSEMYIQTMYTEMVTMINATDDIPNFSVFRLQRFIDIPNPKSLKSQHT